MTAPLGRTRIFLPLISFTGTISVLAAELRPDTVSAWNRYAELTEARIDGELSDASTGEGFLVFDHLDPADRSRCEQEVSAGRVCIVQLQTLDGEGKRIDVPEGMIHHWYGAIRVPGASLEEVLDWVQTYDGHEVYYPEVEESRLISRDGDVFDIFLRLKRTKVITVHYSTDHQVTYQRHPPNAASSRSIATRIQEIEDAGKPNERNKPQGNDSGYLWRLNSYWRFQEQDGGTFVECESISLSRDVPVAALWLIRSFLSSVPRESLESTLVPIRANLAK